jgi:ACR3 family arsenite transporter
LILASQIESALSSELQSASENEQHSSSQSNGDEKQKSPLGLFGKTLPIWVLVCIVLGATIGALAPEVAEVLSEWTVAQISVPVTILLWFMVYPMMLSIEWRALKNVRKHYKALLLTLFVNWAVQPFAMYGIALLFFRVFYGSILSEDAQEQYVAGAVILGGSPCTAMVFVWSQLARGDAAYTLVQVALNDIVLLILYVPTIVLLLGLSDIVLPWGTVFLSVVLFIVVPLCFGAVTRYVLLRTHGKAAVDSLIERCSPITIVALLLTLILIFIFQGMNCVVVVVVMVVMVMVVAVVVVVCERAFQFFIDNAIVMCFCVLFVFLQINTYSRC